MEIIYKYQTIQGQLNAQEIYYITCNYDTVLKIARFATKWPTKLENDVIKFAKTCLHKLQRLKTN